MDTLLDYDKPVIFYRSTIRVNAIKLSFFGVQNMFCIPEIITTDKN